MRKPTNPYWKEYITFYLVIFLPFICIITGGISTPGSIINSLAYLSLAVYAGLAVLLILGYIIHTCLYE